MTSRESEGVLILDVRCSPKGSQTVDLTLRDAVVELLGGRTDPVILNLEIDACRSSDAIGELVSIMTRLQPPTRMVVTSKKTREVLMVPCFPMWKLFETEADALRDVRRRQNR